MILKKIRIVNIRSYKDVEIEFPEGSTLLMGDIGSGKTSVLLAVEFALFGLQPGQRGNSLLRNNEKEGKVVLDFEVDDTKVTIERGIEKSGKSISQTNTSINIGNERFEGSVTEIKNKILSVLNYPPEFAKKTNDLYKFTVYTPQEEMKQIIQESNDVRLNTLRHVFGIDKYKRIEENIGLITTKLRQEVKIKEVEIGNIEQKKQLIQDKKILIQNEKVKIAEVEKEIANICKVKEEKQTELEEITKKINEKNKIESEKEKSEIILANKKENIDNYSREIKNISEQIKTKDQIKFKPEDIDILKTRIKSQEQILRDLNDQYILLITFIQSQESNTQDLKKLKEKITALEKCPTCLQIVNDEYKRNIVQKAESELLSKDAELIKKKAEKEEILKQINQTKKLIDSLRESLAELEILKIRLESIKEKETRIIILEKQRSTAFNDIEMMKKHIEGLSSMLQSFEAYSIVYEKKNRELKEVITQENSLSIKRAEINKDLSFLEIQISDLEKEIAKIEEIARKINYLKEVEYWLNNKFIELVLHTEKNVMLKLREEFSELFSNWFSVLVHDSIRVRLDESFSPVIQQQDYEIDYNFLSGGEKTAVALAYRLALNQVINSVLSRIKTRDLVILDEPTDGFSESQLDKIRDVLGQLKVKQLIIVSHEQKVEGFVDNIIRFKKIEGITQIEK